MSKDSTLRIIFGGKNWKRESSPYGWRVHPVTKKKKFHYGADFACNKVPVYAIESGTVESRGYQKNGAGRYVYVKYPRLGVRVAYFHLDSYVVRAGMKVSKGTKIGTAGTTGSSTGVHLHIGVKNSAGKWINADTWLANYKAPSSSSSSSSKLAVPTATVKKGSKGENVKRLQRCLNKIMNAKLSVDGIAGAKTVQAIKNFQKKYGLSADGIAGTKTLAKIKSLV